MDVTRTQDDLAGDVARRIEAQNYPPSELEVFARNGIKACVALSHGIAVGCGWWTDLATGERKDRNVGELLALIHSEVSEALEGHRKSKPGAPKMDEHLPHRTSFEVELGDALIRIFDLAGAHGLDLAGAVIEKMWYNLDRTDHKLENRRAAGGKQF